MLFGVRHQLPLWMLRNKNWAKETQYSRKLKLNWWNYLDFHAYTVYDNVYQESLPLGLNKNCPLENSTKVKWNY